MRTAQGTVRAKDVVFAGGGYARGVSPRIERAVLPIATYVIATEPLGARLPDAIDAPYAIYDTRFAFDYYRPLKDTRIPGAAGSPCSTAAPTRSRACCGATCCACIRNWKA